jgi:hypothetical protein
MNIQQFFIQWNGKKNNNGSYPGECVDIIKQYFQDVLNIAPINGNAISYWNNIQGFTKIKNTILGKPLPGDIVIWNMGKYGHIGICNWSTLFQINCFEQNFPSGTPCHFQTHNYKNVLGWLRPIPVVSDPILPHIPIQIARIGLQLARNEEFNANVDKYSSNKISITTNDYNASFTIPQIGMINQEEAYKIVDFVNPKEKFIFIFYPPNNTSSFYATYYDPQRDCVITTCPGIDARLLTFEFAHQLQIFYNTHRGGRPYVEIVDSNFPNDELIKTKYNSISEYYN